LLFFGGGVACWRGIWIVVCDPPTIFRISIVFCKFGNVGIILGRFNTAGNCGFSEMAEKFGLVIGAVKNDGMLVGIVVPVVFDPNTDVNCCADAGRACAKNNVIPRNSTRMRTVHLPRFENRAIQPLVVPGP
jgi:hypothetical protein